MGKVAESVWGLNPWTETIEFVPVAGNGRAAWRVPEPAREIAWWPGRPAAFETRVIDLWRKQYASPALKWRGFVYVAEHDEGRLLAALQAVESFLLLMALAAGGAP